MIIMFVAFFKIQLDPGLIGFTGFVGQLFENGPPIQQAIGFLGRNALAAVQVKRLLFCCPAGMSK